MATVSPIPTARNYTFEVFFSDEDDCFVANVPDLKYCSALGATREQAVAELEVAVEAWLAAALDSGRPIPRPEFKPQVSH